MAVSVPALTRRELNRATLERQFLLRRTGRTVTDVVTHLVGLQAQTTHSWYTGLWCRIEGFDPDAVGRQLTDRALVRLPLMRSTLHLVTPEDSRDLRAVTQPAMDRDLAHSVHGKALRGHDTDAIVATGRELLNEQPLTVTELGQRLSEHWPEVPGRHLAYAVRCLLPLVQVPPRGVWGASGLPALAPADSWTGLPAASAPDADTLVLRYLAAFGPAGVKDVQAWSGLTRLREVVDRLRGRLVCLRSEDGAELFDLPEAPRPAPDVPAPPRFLYDLENLLRSYADRSRVITAEHLKRISARNAMPPATVLVDGTVRGAWRVVRARGTATVEVTPFTPLTGTDAEEVTVEGLQLLRLLAPEHDGHDVRILPVP